MGSSHASTIFFRKIKLLVAHVHTSKNKRRYFSDNFVPPSLILQYLTTE